MQSGKFCRDLFKPARLLMNVPHLLSVRSTCGITDRNFCWYNSYEMLIIYLLCLQRKGLAQCRSAVINVPMSAAILNSKITQEQTVTTTRSNGEKEMKVNTTRLHCRLLQKVLLCPPLFFRSKSCDCISRQSFELLWMCIMHPQYRVCLDSYCVFEYISLV